MAHYTHGTHTGGIPLTPACLGTLGASQRSGWEADYHNGDCAAVKFNYTYVMEHYTALERPKTAASFLAAWTYEASLPIDGGATRTGIAKELCMDA